LLSVRCQLTATFLSALPELAKKNQWKRDRNVEHSERFRQFVGSKSAFAVTFECVVYDGLKNQNDSRRTAHFLPGAKSNFAQKEGLHVFSDDPFCLAYPLGLPETPRLNEILQAGAYSQPCNRS